MGSFVFAPLESSRRLANARAIAKVAGRGRLSLEMLRRNGAALIGTIDKRADCRGIRRKRRLSATANRAALPHLEWTARWPAAGDFPILGAFRNAAFWHFNCLVTRGRWWPGTLVVTNRPRFPPFRIINS